MDTNIGNGRDIVTFLHTQHEQIKVMFEDVLRYDGERRERAFTALRRMLAIHETAEEEIVHPAARHAIPNGEAVIEARLGEENQAKRALSELEKLDVDSDEFEIKFRALHADVLKHAESEELEEFAKLPSRVDRDELERIRAAAELAERVAPTRPHPGIESSTANFIVGPFAAMLDRARDALAKH